MIAMTVTVTKTATKNKTARKQNHRLNVRQRAITKGGVQKTCKDRLLQSNEPMFPYLPVLQSRQQLRLVHQVYFFYWVHAYRTIDATRVFQLLFRLA